MEDRRAKYERFRSLLVPPLDQHPSGTFPLTTGSAHFDLTQYQRESAGHNVEMFDNLITSQPNSFFADIGCGLRERTFDNCLYLEVYPSKSADLIVEPDCYYPIKDGTLAGIGCFAVLEHTRKPWIVVQEMRRMLQPGGYVMIDWPFLQPVHGYPSHFFNATRQGLSSIFEDQGFNVSLCYTGAHQSAAYTLNWILGVFIHRLPEQMRNEFERMSIGELATLPMQGDRWQRYVKALSADAQSELACGNMLVATKI